MSRILAIDQGTTSTRAVLFAGQDPPRLVASRRHHQSFPGPGRVEQDPLELLADIEACIAAAGPVDAIGIANQGESCLAWDAGTGEPFTPVLTWQDARTLDTVNALRSANHETEVRRKTGLPLDCYFSASKLAWIMREVPAARAALKRGTLRIGTTDAFVLDRLTGRFVTDTSTAARTALMDLASLRWDAALCELFEIPIGALPRIVPTTGNLGRYRGIPITASVVDQPAALRGHDATGIGDIEITFGTGAFILAHAGGNVPADREDGIIRTVAWHDGASATYALEGGVYDAGAAINGAAGSG